MKPQHKIECRVMLVLRVPPPWGGGEILAAEFGRYAAKLPDFCVVKLSRLRGSKADQGRLSFRKITSIWEDWITVVAAARKARPSVVYMALGKAFPHFLKDSILILVLTLMGCQVTGEVAGRGLYFLRSGGLRSAYARWVLRRMVSVRLLGPSIVRDFIEYGVTNTVWSDNGVPDPQMGRPGVIRPREGRAKSADLRILFMGAHSRDKGLDLAVHAVRDLVQQGYEISLETAGEWVDPDFRREMEEVVRENNLDEHIIFGGFRFGDERFVLFERNDVLVLPSHNEGQPLVILEAFAMEMPVVATNVGAVGDTVEHGVQGILLERPSADDVAAALERIAKSPAQLAAMGQSARQAYLSRFTEDHYFRGMVAWLRECAAGSFRSSGQQIRVPEVADDVPGDDRDAG